MNPVFAFVVSDAAVESVRRQHEDEMASVADADEQIFVELAGTKLVYVDEHGQTTQLQVNFQQTAHDIVHRHSATECQLYEVVQKLNWHILAFLITSSAIVQFPNFFIVRIGRKFAINIPSLLECVATLPCEMSVS